MSDQRRVFNAEFKADAVRRCSEAGRPLTQVARELNSARRISQSVGMRALQAGHRVYFLTAQDLLDQIRIAQLDGVPGHKQRHLDTVPLLIIDELGYVEFDKSAATWLFQLICQRYEHRSTLLRALSRFQNGGRSFPIRR